MVYIQLSEEEKLQVVLLAVSFFSAALILSVCLAATFCPLNRWLLKRSERRRQRKLQQQHINTLNSQIQQRARQQHLQCHHHHHQHLAPGQSRLSQFNQRAWQWSCPKNGPIVSSYLGPPPAYEAALRATRLQSLTGGLYSSKPESEVPPSPVLQKNSRDELDLGDYFHQPQDIPQDHLPLQQVHIPMGDFSSQSTESKLTKGQKIATTNWRPHQQPPVMLRLWVKVLEPGELVTRARGSRTQEPFEGASDESLAHSTIRRLSLSRQISLPQFIGSLVGSLSKGEEASGCDKREEQMSSSAGQLAPAFKSSGKASRQVVPDNRMLKTITAITSRVLHMNVASFSYVKDESVISSKKHSQMNFSQFCSQFNKPTQQQQQQNQAETIGPHSNSNNDNQDKNKKLCQLVISICDVENILNSSWLNERSCALLANNSAIYVQCEILLPKSKSARILGPLRTALANNSAPDNVKSKVTIAGASQDDNKRHTVNFASVISASAIERPPVGGYNNMNLTEESMGALGEDSLTRSSLSSATGSSSTEGSSCQNQSQQELEQQTGSKPPASTNWRHEPNADGQSIVVFSSVPKEIALQQQLTASAAARNPGSGPSPVGQHSPLANNKPLSDMIQFDSVFVSPILNRSSISEGYIRLRIYSQCKYVNETCLAELKLPLKQLMHSETSDNLNDASSDGLAGSANNHQQQADFILDNLLANLVTASTGSPLSTLIEQISSEEREAAEMSSGRQLESSGPGSLNRPIGKSSMLSSISWLSANSQAQANHPPQSDHQHNTRSSQSSANGMRASHSYNEALHKLDSSINSSPACWLQSEQETERRIEENYMRSLMVSHWLNYLVAPSYECQLVKEPKGKIILGLSYLPTSNRVIFNATRASIDDESYASGKQLMKNLRLQASTCYLLRFMMLINGRVVKRKQTPVSRKPEWDSQEAITFDLVSVSVQQPAFIVALVMRNSAGALSAGGLRGSGSASNQQHVCSCGFSQNQQPQQQPSQAQTPGSSTARATGRAVDVHSEPESLQHLGYQRASPNGCAPQNHEQQAYHNGATSNNTVAGSTTNNNSATNSGSQFKRHAKHEQLERDLVIGHLVLAEQIWAEMRGQPRKQIVKQFKMY